MALAGQVLHSVTPGLARLAQLFTADVRERARRYLDGERVQVWVDDATELSGIVAGTDEYLVAFEHVRGRLVYGCSCPFFQDRLVGCKHLWALAVTAGRSVLVASAAECSHFEARSELPFGAVDDEDEDYEDDQDAPASEPASFALIRDLERSRERLEQARRSEWRRLAHLAHPTPGASPVQPLYLLAPVPRQSWQSSAARLELALGVRQTTASAKAHAASTVLKPLSGLKPDALRDPIDRAILALLQACRQVTSFSNAQNAMELADWLLEDILESLVKTGRCHLMPADFPAKSDESWLNFRTGTSPRGRRAKLLGVDYDSFLHWPLLTRDSAGPWQLEMRFALESDAGPEHRDRIYTVTAELARGEEKSPGSLARVVLPSGRALLGASVVDLAPGDARWLSSLQQMPSLIVAEADLPEFAALAFGRGGVSRFVLPEGYGPEKLQERPVKVLELGAPGPRSTPGDVYFSYGKTRVRAAHPARLLFLAEQRVLPRDTEFEEAALAELRDAGLKGELLTLADATRAASARISEQAAVVIPTAELLQAIRALIALGWQVFGEGKRYRALSSFEIAIESGLDWFEVKGHARFESAAEVPFPRLLTALKQQRRVVALGDGSHGVLPEEWAARFATLAELLPAKGETLRVSKRQLGVLEMLCAAAPNAAGAEALAELRSRLERFRQLEPRAPEAGFRGELRQYQTAGLGFLHTAAEFGFGACLADDMGLGKTIQVLAHLQAVHRSERAPRNPRKKRLQRRSLVIVPRSLLGNWLEEAKRFTPDLAVHVHWGPERGAPGAAWGDAELILTTYGTLRLDAVALAEIDFEIVVLDEAQAIKNEASATAKAARLLRGRQRLAMSGTPIENHLGELWSLFEFLNPGLLNELPGLEHAIGRARPSAESCELIRLAVRPFILRRTKREVAKDLPERIEQTLYVELDRDERAHYDELARHYRASIGKKLAELGPERSTPHVLEALLRLRQAACHPGLIDRGRDHASSAKIELLLDQLRSVRAEGHQALVFSQFTSLLSIVRRRLEEEKVDYEYLDGKTADRAERVRRFQSNPSVSVFLISLKAGGVGLNLTSAEYVFILDPWWNPAAEAQAIDRAHRIGQTRTVIAYRLLSRGTVEERVAELQQQKRDLVDSLFSEGALSRKLTREDLQALLDIGKIP